MTTNRARPLVTLHPEPQKLDRYVVYGEIAHGGMAVVQLGKMTGPAGFARTVAIKRLHADLAGDAQLVSMLLDEALLAGRIHHPNVIAVLDVVLSQEDVVLVMEFVLGETLSKLARRALAAGQRVPVPIAAAIIVGVLEGLHAAHEARAEDGEPLGIIHRDVSPQNILVGMDGLPRVFDFGIAKARWRSQWTQEGQVKGKLAYLAPEQIRGAPVDRRVDIYAASLVLWELLVGRRYLTKDHPGAMLAQALSQRPEPPSRHAPGVPPALDAIVLRGMAQEPRARFRTAREMAHAIEGAVPIASVRQIAAWVERTGGEALLERARLVATLDSSRRIPVQPQPIISMVVPSTHRAVAEDEPPTVRIESPRGRALALLAAALFVLSIAAAVFVAVRFWRV
jgi:serine/threonine-protein kinase